MTSAAGDRVHDIAQIGNTVYVAGTFSGLRQTRTGTITPRTNLAAFDATTGAPRTGFHPTINGAVYTLEPSADGRRLYLGGAFTTVNGLARKRLVALDPATGAVVAGFTPNLGGGHVRSMVLRDGVLYAGGTFASASGQARPQLAAFDTAGTGAPLSTWRPAATGGAVLSVEITPDGSRLYVAGRFTAVNAQPNSGHLVALDRATGDRIPSFAAQPGREVYDVLADDRGLVWTAQGGSLGRVDVYRAVDGSLLTRHETAGDAESVEQVGGLIYVGGHDIGPSEVEHVGVIDPAAPAILDASAFNEPTTGGDGIWAFHSTGRDLWVGGNVSGPHFGFARYPARAEAPARVELSPVLAPWRYLDTAAAPAAWRASHFDDTAWPTGSAELGFGDGGEATVLRNGRVTYYFRRTFTVTDVAHLTDLRLDLLADDGAAVAVNGTEVVRSNLPTGTLTDTTRATSGLSGNPEDSFRSFSVPTSALVEGTNTIAVEVHQNAAASSDLSFDARLSAVRSTAPPPPTPLTVVPRGTTWRYRDQGTDPGATWSQPAFDDGRWPTGRAILGREEGGEATVLAPGAGARWFRRTFPIANASAVTALRLDLMADDGAVAYVNGTEVVRDNLPAGAITAATSATDYRQGTAERAVRSFVVPPSVLRNGINVLAVRLHQAPGSPDASFDAALVATGATADTTAPSVPTGLAAPTRTSSTVHLTWTASTDDVGVERYEVVVDGTPVGTTTGTSFTVSGLAPASAHTVAVEAIDAGGNRSGRTAGLGVSAAGAPSAPVELVPRGDTWRYLDAGPPPAATWAAVGFDDSAWRTGRAEIGREDGDEVTLLGSAFGTRWFRRTFTVTGAAGLGPLALEVLADDGSVLYHNGVEVARDNMPAGPITATTPTADYRTGLGETQWHTFTVPASALVDGTNVLAVEVHQGAGSTDVSFDARLRST
jgi:hypothetical protein